MPVRLVIEICPHCEEVTLQKEVYGTRADGTDVVYMTTCTVCNKDL